MTEENKVLFRRFIEAENRADLETMSECASPEIVDHAATLHTRAGLEGVKRTYLEFREQYPDFHYTIEDLLSDGDRVVCRWTLRGTQRATGEPLLVRGINIDRIVGGKIVEHWASHNRVSD